VAEKYYFLPYFTEEFVM